MSGSSKSPTSMWSLIFRGGADTSPSFERMRIRVLKRGQRPLEHRAALEHGVGGRHWEEKMRIFSFDAEVDGLYGPAFAIAAVIREDGREVVRFVGRAPDSLVKDEWVRKNVLPALVGMAVTHISSVELEESFWAFWEAQKAGAVAIAHCGSPVESGLFRRCVERAPAERTFAGPFPLHEVGTILFALGEDPTSVDAYLKKYALDVPFEGVTHHPLYDARAASVVWEHALARVTSK